MYNDFVRELSALIKRNKRFCLYTVILRPRKESYVFSVMFFSTQLPLPQ